MSVTDSCVNFVQFDKIQSLTGNASYKIKPQHIIEVIYSDDAEKKFEQLQSLHGKIYAYHGTRVENFHSILHNGLLSHMNKVKYLSGIVHQSKTYKFVSNYLVINTCQ